MRATDVSEPGRHLALIALDGAVEYALWLVVHTLGAPLKGDRPSFTELTRAVHKQLEADERDWSERGRAGVDQLRRARNPAQHASVQFDAGQLPAWTDATVAYIDSLLVAAFGLRIDDLVLALAVRDADLRERLASAERALQLGDPEIAFSMAWIAFEIAVGSWRETRTGVAAAFAEAPPPVFRREGDDLRERLAVLEALADVQPFAPDLGEYFSLARARAQQEQSGWKPEEDDARRALRFATGWIVRWEVFTRGYPAERWFAWQAEIRPPTVGDGTTPSILHASAYAVRPVAGNPRWSVHAQLANVPEEGRGDWGVDLTQCFVDAGRETGEELRLHRLTFGGPSGRLTLELDPDVDADAVALALERAVRLADERYRSRLDRRQQDEDERRAREDQWRSALDRTSEGTLELVALHGEARGDGRHLVAELQLAGEATELEVLSVAELLRSRGGSLAGAGVRNSRVFAEAVDLDGPEGAAVRDALANAAAEVRRRRSAHAAALERYRAFAIRLEELLGSPPRET